MMSSSRHHAVLRDTKRAGAHRGLDDGLADNALVQLWVQHHVGPQVRLHVGLPFNQHGSVTITVAICVWGLVLLRGGGSSGGGAECQEEWLLHPPDPDRPLPRSQLRRHKKIHVLQ